MTSNKTAAGRVADMRKCYANSPEPVDHLSDLELVFRELDAAITGERSLQVRYDRMLQEQNRHERDVRTAARRAAQDDRLAYANAYMGELLRRARQPIRALSYRAGQIGPRVGKDQLDELHRNAAEVADLLKEPVKSDELSAADRWRNETWRLRDFIKDTGRALHAELSTGTVPCHCRGCELIHGMDDVEMPADGAA
jgi:hypothetical protein